MKKLIFIALAAMLAGCSPKPDPRIADLQKQVTDLKTEADDNRKYIDSVFALAKATANHQTNVNAALESRIFMLEIATNAAIDPATGLILPTDSERISRLEMQYSNLCLTINGHALRPAPLQNAAPPAANGIPANVLAQIRADAAAKWPDKYDMQVWEIQQQTEAWLKLHGNQQ